MSIFNELLSKVLDISKQTEKNFNDELKAAFEALDQFVEDHQNGLITGRKDAQKEKNLMTTLQSINEDDDDTSKILEATKTDTDNGGSSVDSSDGHRRLSKKRGKDEVEGVESPGTDKRQKRKCHVKAQSNITKQVNTNLIQKLRREDTSAESSRVARKDDGKGAQPVPQINIKQEKMSLPSEPMETEPLPVNDVADIKREMAKDEVAMPPPAAPVPRPRRAPQSDRSEDVEEEWGPGRRRTNRSRKQTETMPPPPAPSTRSTRASSRASRRTTKLSELDASKPEAEPAPLETRPKRTRNKKVDTSSQPNSSQLNNSQPNNSQLNNSHLNNSQEMLCEWCSPPRYFKGQRGLNIHIAKFHKTKQTSETTSIDSEKENLQPPQNNGIDSPTEKPRPKRTRRGQKAAEKEQEQHEAPEPQTAKISPKEERISHPEPMSPVLQTTVKQLKINDNNLTKHNSDEQQVDRKTKHNRNETKKQDSEEKQTNNNRNNTQKHDTEETQPKNNRNVTQKQDSEETQTKNNRNNTQKQDSEETQTKNNRNNTQKQDSEEIQTKNNRNNTQKQDSEEIQTKNNRNNTQKPDSVEIQTSVALEEPNLVLSNKINVTVTLSDMDKTMVLPNGVYSHPPVTPTAIASVACNVNETIVLETHSRETMVLGKPHGIMDATVVLERDPIVGNMTNNSILTDDNSDLDAHTPPKEIPKHQPTSAVKVKVQQFEEMAARTTRTKTRAMAKMDDQDNQTPPDKMIKPVLSAETLNKMNNLIFNGKQPQMSSSASKPRVPSARPAQPASTSKLSALGRHREAAEDTLSQREDARKKKEALLEAKREQQKKKREDKMAAAAAAREAAERDRRLAMEAAARERVEKQAHADQGKLERLKEVERKKQELARKVAETEERRRAEEHARQQRLAEEQKRADAARRKQIEEAEAMKKEEAIMAKEFEKRQRAYNEKQKLKHRLESDKSHTPLKTPGHWVMEPTYMADGFQYLVPDEEEDQIQRPVPAWSASKARRLALSYQSAVRPALVDSLFSVRVHSPDLREIFPDIERGRLKRTSSAVWRTPPAHKQLPTLAE